MSRTSGHKCKAAHFSWDRIDKCGPEECWPWKGSVNRWGYGACQVAGVQRNASRAAYESVHGVVPKGLVVCHRCDNPRCCNPAHLWAATQAENLADCRNKGRQVYRYGIFHHKATAKLTDDLVREARSRFAAGETQTDIAIQMNVCSSSLSRAIRGATWAHVK